MKKLAMIVLVTAALGFTAAPAFAYNNLIYHLAKYGCEGLSSYHKNGCYAYLDPRILKKKDPQVAYDACKRQCNDWFGYTENGKKKCYEGGKYLLDME